MAVQIHEAGRDYLARRVVGFAVVVFHLADTYYLAILYKQIVYFVNAVCRINYATILYKHIKPSA